jgi:hypothetical protein
MFNRKTTLALAITAVFGTNGTLPALAGPRISLPSIPSHSLTRSLPSNRGTPRTPLMMPTDRPIGHYAYTGLGAGKSWVFTGYQ